MTECPHCYVQVALDAFGGHMYWHNQQNESREMLVTSLEGLTNIVEKLLKAHLPRGRM